MERRCINLIKQELRRKSLPSCHRPWARPPAGLLAPSQPSLSLPNPTSTITLGISFPGFDHVQPSTDFFPPAAAALRRRSRSLPGRDDRGPPRSRHRGPGDLPLLGRPLRAAAGHATSRHHRAAAPAVAAAAPGGLRRALRAAATAAAPRHHPARVAVAVPAPCGPRRGRGPAAAAGAAATQPRASYDRAGGSSDPTSPVPALAVTASVLDRYPPRVGGGEAAGCCARPPSASACAGDAWSAAAAPPSCPSLRKGPRSHPLRRGSWACGFPHERRVCCFPHVQRPQSLQHRWLGAHPSSTGAHRVTPLHSAAGRREGASAGRSCDLFQVAIHMHSFCPDGVHGIQVAVHVHVRRAAGVHFLLRGPK